MNSLAFAFASVVLLLPREYHIDCSGWPGVAAVKITVRITAADGTVYEHDGECQSSATPQNLRDILAYHLEEDGNRGYKVGKAIYVLQGFKKSAIRSVEFTSKDWKPDVRVVLKVPEKR